MEIHCGEDILCYVDEDAAGLLLNHDTENSSNDFDKWLQKNDYNTSQENNLISLETDPLLSEVQVFDRPTFLDAFEIIPQPQPVPKKPKPKESRPAILRSVNKKTDLNVNAVSSNLEMTKNDILKERPPATVEMTFQNNIASLNFKDAHGQQPFSTQHMQLPGNYMRPEKLQKIQSLTFVPICKKLRLTLPQIVTNLGGKIHLCPLNCNRAFLHIADAKLHTLQHMQIKPYKCDNPGCTWEFYTACKLARHVETHAKNRNFICDIGNCGKGFSTIYNLNIHKKIHVKPATLPCLVKRCNLLFQNENQRRAHYKTHDYSEAPFRCTNGSCEKSFFTKVLLDSHLRACSRNESDLICNYPNCGKTFTIPYRLREHIRQHTGARPYRCKFENCTWSFATASKLKRHSSIHTRDRKFHCTMGGCTKSFLRSEHLKDHTLTHIEKRPQEFEGKSSLGQSKKYTEKKIECTRVQPEEGDSIANNNNADVLLEQAIQSLGVPSDIILGTGLIPDEPLALLETENVSTVNLRDLD